MGRSLSFWGHLHRFRLVLLWTIAGGAFVVFLWILRNSSYTADPLLDTYLQMAGSLIAFTFAANALVRFRGTHDRISLILAFGFVLAGLIEAGTSMTFYRGMLVTPTPGDSHFLRLARRPHSARRSAAGGPRGRTTHPDRSRTGQGNGRRHSDRWRGRVSHQRLLFHVAARAEDSSRRHHSATCGSAARCDLFGGDDRIWPPPESRRSVSRRRCFSRRL